MVRVDCFHWSIKRGPCRKLIKENGAQFRWTFPVIWNNRCPELDVYISLRLRCHIYMYNCRILCKDHAGRVLLCLRSSSEIPWWRHQIETLSALLALCEGNSPVNYPHKGQWRRALMFSSICAWINGWVNNREAGYLRHHRAHYDVTVMRTTSLARTTSFIGSVAKDTTEKDISKHSTRIHHKFIIKSGWKWI